MKSDETRITPNAGDALLTVADVAEILSTTPVQVRNMRARGQLPAPVERPGLHLRWLASDIERFVVSGMTAPPMRQAPHPPPRRAASTAKPATTAKPTPMQKHRDRLKTLMEDPS